MIDIEDGNDVTLQAGTGLTIAESGSTITLASTATDNQNLSVTAGATDTSVIDIEDGNDVILKAGTRTTISESGNTITLGTTAYGFGSAAVWGLTKTGSGSATTTIVFLNNLDNSALSRFMNLPGSIGGVPAGTQLRINTTGVFRLTFYADFYAGTATGNGCTDFSISVNAQDGSQVFVNNQCADVGSKNADRKSGTIQVVFSANKTFYVTFGTSNPFKRGSVIIEKLAEY